MKKVLLVEDTQSLREEVSQVLRLEKLYVMESAYGETAVELARLEVPDLIICDILLPDIDGYQVLKRIRENPLTEKIPFVFISALISPENLSKGAEMGSNDYLIKPFRIEDLLETIKANIGTKVLLIEDTKEIREEVAAMLQFENYLVFEAENSSQAFEIISSDKPDIIICDIILPGEDGFEILKKVRENPLTEGLPFIFLSALAFQDSLVKGAEMGATEYLIKPFQPEELLHIISTYTNNRN